MIFFREMSFILLSAEQGKAPPHWWSKPASSVLQRLFSLRFGLFHSKWKEKLSEHYQAMGLDNDCALSFGLPFYFTSSNSTSEQQDSPQSQKSSYQYCSSSEKHCLSQQSSIFPRNVHVMKVPKTALLSIVSCMNQAENLHSFALTIICSK